MIDGSEFGTRKEPCHAGHGAHDTVDVSVVLDRQHSHDFAYFPKDRTVSFSMEVYDESKYSDTVGYCIGRSAVGHAIRTQGVWESYETRLALEIFATGKGDVLDFGCNQGWYTLLAALHGHRVIGFDNEAETLAICRRNLERNAVAEYAQLVEAWIDDNTPQFEADADVLLLKADVEGAEFEVVKACWDLFAGRRIEYALLEISPCFRDGYDKLLERIMDAGYSCHVVPNKTSKYRMDFSMDPLGNLHQTEMKRYEIGRWIKRIRQENVILVRK